MYGLNTATLLAYTQLVNTLKDFGYQPIPGTMGLWKHATRPISFCLCVDDFGVKYQNKEDVTHLLNALGSKYKYSVDWSGSNYCGLHMKWNYDKRYVDISMPGYIIVALTRLQYIPSKYPQYSPHFHQPIRY